MLLSQGLLEFGQREVWKLPGWHKFPIGDGVHIEFERVLQGCVCPLNCDNDLLHLVIFVFILRQVAKYVWQHTPD